MKTAASIVDKLLEDGLDVDSPDSVLRTHPGFEYKSTMYQGDMVFVKGVDAGEDTSDWPCNIGNVLGPAGPAGNRWYVIGVRSVPPERLEEYGFGVKASPTLRTFASRDDAALAIWLVYSKFDDERKRLWLPKRPKRS